MSTQPPAAAGRLWLQRLTLTDFRGYAGARLALDQRPVVLTGPNGAGKTNLLEAISFLGPGRGLRRAALDEVTRIGAPAGAAWAVAAEVVTPEGSHSVGTGLDPAGETARRLTRVDGRPARSLAELGRLLPMSWLVPAMDRLFVEGPGQRRRFLDRLVFALRPDHAGDLAAYDQALRERARLLAMPRRDAGWLDAVEAQMAEQGVAVAAGRRELVARMAAAAQADGFPAAAIGLRGRVEDWLDERPALAAEEALRAALAAARGRDAAAGGAAEGPHRSDLLVRHAGKDMPAAQCSTGEQKALLIGLVLAHARLVAAERGAAPLLLLDEVAAHLDRDRRAALFRAVLALGSQAWLTGTDQEIFAEFGSTAREFTIRNAHITETSRG